MAGSCFRVLTVVAALLAASDVHGSPIKHIVVIMMENHSFDNMLGWTPGIGDLTGAEYNLLNASNPSSKMFNMTKGATYCTVPDPDHSWPGTELQVFAPHIPPFGTVGTPTMGGFAQSYAGEGGNPTEVMQGYTQDQVPIITTLAQEFVACTNYYASLPGPTGPNRMFVHTATTLGYDGSNYANYPLKTRSFYEDLMADGLDWAIHFHDFTTAHGIAPLNTFTKNFVQDPGFDKFFGLLENGTLPSYTFLVPLLSPNFGMQPTSQHPDYDIRAGEAQLKLVYETLRASSAWNETLLAIIYDEHGGFYDHRAPPSGVPNPCPTCTPQPYPFAFDRLGVRLPGIFISPWLPKTLDDTVYDHTSVLRTARKIFNMSSPPLSPREAAANDFFDLFLTQPRTDTPTTLPPVPTNPPRCTPPLSHLSGLAKEYLKMYDSLLEQHKVSLDRTAADVTCDRDAGQFMMDAITAMFGTRV
eukprot:TRINITY_DN18594_c0_g1_i1.p1 TRINITY_DN18594_c0_g1~~TRINITY_DN18594_c0_g1_i1.p1  ORF type:complete len:471 (+),score=146.77 TRINITY_DN18594_c0_g1_i1:130-1542(+)